MSVALSPFWLRKGTLESTEVFVDVLVGLALPVLSVLAQPVRERIARTAAARRIGAGNFSTSFLQRPDHPSRWARPTFARCGSRAWRSTIAQRQPMLADKSRLPARGVKATPK